MSANATPSDSLLKAVRGHLIMSGSSLSAWADSNGVKRQNLTKAITGEWRGPKAQMLLDKIVHDVMDT